MKSKELNIEMAENLLEKYSKLGVKFTLKENDLGLKAPKGVVNETVLSEIKDNKSEIIEAIRINESRNTILKAEDKDYYRLSSTQYGIWTQTFMNTGKKAYNMLSSYTIKGFISLDLLEKSFRKVIEKNEILRTNIVLTDEGVFQKIQARDAFRFDLEIIDLKGDLTQMTQHYSNHIFDLERDLLIKVVAIKEREDLIHLIVIVHHVILDGVSVGLMFNELFTNYRTMAEGKSLNIMNGHSNGQIQYKDFAEWEQGMQESGGFERDKLYWLKQFEGGLEPIDLAGYKPRPNVKTYAGANFKKKISGEHVERFIEMGRENGVSFFQNFIALLNVLLNKYTGQKDLILGAPFSLRNSNQLESNLGLYISTYPVRTIIEDNDTYVSLLRKVSSFVNQAMDNSGYSFHKLVEDLDIKRDPSRHPLFDIFVSSQDGVNTNFVWDGLELKENDVFDNSSKFDIEFYVEGVKDEINLLIYYNTDIYNLDFINQFTAHLENLMEKVVNDQVKLTELSLLSNVENALILKDFNQTEIGHEGTVLDAIATHNDLMKTAVFDEAETLNYVELDKRSDIIAENLNNILSEEQKYVAVSIDRSGLIIPLILGIFKSGRVYVPMDPIFPKGRIKQLMNKFGIDLLVSDELWEDTGFASILVSKLLDGEVVDKSGQKSIAPSDPAYLIFTSGTTGMPKGVEVSHAALNNFIKSMIRKPEITQEDLLLSVTTYSFDISLLELLGPLCVGASVYVAKDKETKDPNIWKSLCEKLTPTIIQATPSFYQMLFNFGWKPSTSVKLLSGGEPISATLSGKLIKAVGGYWNMYGPTETTIWSTINWITSHEEANTIGKPIDNTQVYILDDHLNPLPVGVIGNIYIGGDGLAIGYKDNPEMTREKFIDSPFENTARLYATGDLGKWNTEGKIEFVGRKDYQIKFRGYRIELGEIEYYINKFSDEITNAVVILVKNGDNEILKAFYTASVDDLDQVALEKYLRSFLPAYMVPSQFIQIEKFELTPNGKIDRKQLSSIETNVNVEAGNEELTEVEEEIQGLWNDVLGLENISIDANFFELGGNSLNIAQIINTVQKTHGLSVSYKEFIENPTIRLISQIVNNSSKQANKFIEIPRTEKKEYYELTKSQYRIWLTSKLGGSKAYNVQTSYMTTTIIDREAFDLAINQVLQRHDSIRTVFKLNEKNKVYQFIQPYQNYQSLFKVGLSDDEVQVVLRQELDIEFDLENGPLFKSGMIHTADNTSVIYFAFHHIISDGWSLEVFLKEVVENYEYFIENGNPLVREELDIQFHDYSEWFNNDLNSEIINQKRFWHKIFEKPVDLIKFPFERPNRPNKKTYNGDFAQDHLDPEKTKQLRKLSKELNVTTFSTLLSVFNLLIYKYTGINDVTTGTPISGRINQQLEHQLGLYINTLPIRTSFETKTSFNELNIEQNKSLFDFYDNQMYQMDNIIEELNMKSVPGRSPLFDTMIVYQNQTENALFANVDKEDRYGVDAIESNVDMYAQFDLSISFSYNAKKGLHIALFFNTDIFEKKHIEKLLEDFIYLMEYRLSHGDSNPEDCFKHASYAFLNDEEIVFEKVETITNESEVQIEDADENNEVKQKLKRIFTQYLESEIQNHEDYFESGGGSLQAINLINEINRNFESHLNIVDFYGNSSINKLHNLLVSGDGDHDDTKGQEADTTSLIEPLSGNISDGKDLIIFFPPIVGIGKFFLSIANQIDEKYNCYAFNVPVYREEISLEDKAVQFYEALQELLANHNEKVVLFGYSSGVNFAYQVAKHFSPDIDLEVVLVDRGANVKKPVVTKRLIRRVIKAQEPLIKSIEQFASPEDTTARIEQTIVTMNAYDVEGQLDFPIYAFECQGNEENGYMNSWEGHSNKFKGVQYIKGNHFQIFEKENLAIFTDFINNL